jgi:hypothetical protein
VEPAELNTKKRQRSRHDDNEANAKEMTSWSDSGTPRAESLFLFLKKLIRKYKNRLDGLAWLLLNNEAEYRFPCLFQDP